MIPDGVISGRVADIDGRPVRRRLSIWFRSLPKNSATIPRRFPIPSWALRIASAAPHRILSK